VQHGDTGADHAMRFSVSPDVGGCQEPRKSGGEFPGPRRGNLMAEILGMTLPRRRSLPLARRDEIATPEIRLRQICAHFGSHLHPDANRRNGTDRTAGHGCVMGCAQFVPLHQDSSAFAT
jgi:hypothetical protein